MAGAMGEAYAWRGGNETITRQGHCPLRSVRRESRPMGMFIGADEIILLHEPNVAEGLMVSSLGRALGVIYADVIKQPVPHPLAALLQKPHERTAVAAADL